MACFSPNQGYERRGMTASGKFTFTYSRDMARIVKGLPVTRVVPCRKCEGCRNDYAREWAVKIQHEASMNFDAEAGVFRNAFITLTYNDDYIPAYGGLDYFGDWTNFLKRFRKAISPAKIRFYMIGEYGDLNLRPHYHAIIFGYDFPDKVFHMHRNGNIIWRSPFLESLWTVPRGCVRAGDSLGFSSVGDVSFASAAYVARYSMKKVIGSDPLNAGSTYCESTGELILGRYQRYNQETGDRVVVARERALMSNRDGIGKTWFDQFALSDLYPKDFTHMPNGTIVRAPKYYDKLLERVNPELLESIKLSRQDSMATHALEFTPERLAVRRDVFLSKLKRLKRESRSIYGT